MANKLNPANPEVSVRYDVFSVKQFEIKGDERAEWRKVGVAFPHRDGKGFNVEFDLLPMDGRLAVRLHGPKESTNE